MSLRTVALHEGLSPGLADHVVAVLGPNVEDTRYWEDPGGVTPLNAENIDFGTFFVALTAQIGNNALTEKDKKIVRKIIRKSKGGTGVTGGSNSTLRDESQTIAMIKQSMQITQGNLKLRMTMHDLLPVSDVR